MASLPRKHECAWTHTHTKSRAETLVHVVRGVAVSSIQLVVDHSREVPQKPIRVTDAQLKQSN